MEAETLTDSRPVPADAATVKACCAELYEHDAVRLLVGESLHPGGLELTERLGRGLQLNSTTRLLDVASGNGASAFRLAERFGCRVTGIDYGGGNVENARVAAGVRGLADLVEFKTADAERLPFADATFDAVICECAFCLFPDKTRAAAELARVVTPGGRVGIADLTRTGDLPPTLQGLMSWIACIADAQPIEATVAYLERSGLVVEHIERHDHALLSLIDDVQLKLLGADILAGLGKLNLPGEGLATAKQFAGQARTAVTAGKIGYATIIGRKPG
jgi:arsenite methyltransferase